MVRCVLHCFFFFQGRRLWKHFIYSCHWAFSLCLMCSYGFRGFAATRVEDVPVFRHILQQVPYSVTLKMETAESWKQLQHTTRLDSKAAPFSDSQFQNESEVKCWTQLLKKTVLQLIKTEATRKKNQVSSYACRSSKKSHFLSEWENTLKTFTKPSCVLTLFQWATCFYSGLLSFYISSIVQYSSRTLGEYYTMDKFQKLSNPKSNTPNLEQ
jgi:hypothetical protein